MEEDVLYCYDRDISELLHLEEEKEYLDESHSKNKIFYNRRSKTFTDENLNKIDISGKKVFPRTGVLQINDMISSIEKNGGLPIISSRELPIINYWTKYYKTKRNTRIVTGKQLLDESFINYIEDNFGSEIFFKTLEKNYSGKLRTEYLRDKDSLIYRTLIEHLDDKFIISEYINISKDEYGDKEYRCFVYNGEIINISRYTDDILHSIDPHIYLDASVIVNRLSKTNYPKSYTLDIAEYQDLNDERQVDVIEINDICSSGTYLYNSVLNLTKHDILHHDKRKVPKEKGDIRDFSLEGEVLCTPSIMYEHNNTFASDMKKIYFCGSKDGYAFYEGRLEINADTLGSHDTIFDFSKCVPISSESDLLKL